MSQFIFLATIYLFLTLLVEKSSSHEITLERLETAFGDDDKVFHFDTLRIKKFNRTAFVVNGNFTVKQDLGPDIDVIAVGLNSQGNQYKKMFDKEIKNVCEAMYLDIYREVFEDYQAHTSKPVAWKTCPYPAGSSEVKNFLIEDSGMILPPYIPGSEKWKAEIRFLRHGNELGGYNIYGIIRSEQSLLGNG